VNERSLELSKCSLPGKRFRSLCCIFIRSRLQTCWRGIGVYICFVKRFVWSDLAKKFFFSDSPRVRFTEKIARVFCWLVELAFSSSGGGVNLVLPADPGKEETVGEAELLSVPTNFLFNAGDCG
jgi:hypothetical protein